jgi:c(7)-type cytochrome triheme protein
MRLPVLLGIVAAAVLIPLAQAVPPMLELEFDGQGEGRVVFSGKVHSGTGMQCADCHLAIFDVARHSRISLRDHRQDVYCFTCHNGETAFAARRNCTNCHAEEPDDDAH